MSELDATSATLVATEPWATSTIGETGKYINGLAFKPTDWGDEGMPIIRIQNLTNPTKPLNRTRRVVDPAYVVNPGDILVSWSATLDAFIWDREPGLLNQHIFKVVPDTSVVTKKFLFYTLKKAIAEMIKSEHLHGSTMKHINRGPFLAHKIEVPTLEQQDEIVAEIEKQFSRLDEAVANLQRVKANLKRYKAAVLKAAVEGRLAERAGGWRTSTLGAEGAIIGGLTKNQKRNALPLKLPYLRVANVYANELRLDDIEYIGVSDKELEKLLVRKGDLLVVEGNGSPDQIGRVALWNDAIPNCVHQNHLIKVRLGDEVLPEWALVWMLSPIGRHEIEQVSASTSGLHTLSVGKVSRLPIGVPSLEEQSRIVAEVDRQLSILRGVETEVNANLQRAQALRQSVLQNAFSESERFDASNSVVTTAARGQEAASVVIAARVIAQNCEAATFGRVKLQKLLFVSTHHARIEASNDEYARLRAGPADLEMLQGVLKRLDQLRWFRERSREQGKRPEGAGYTYERLSLADDYKNHLNAITGDQLKAVDHVCQSLRTWPTDDCELLATVYAAWNDLLLLRRPISDEALVEELHEHWHESKRRFAVQEISAMRKRIVELRLEPTGFGKPTRGTAADVLTKDFFDE